MIMSYTMKNKLISSIVICLLLLAGISNGQYDLEADYATYKIPGTDSLAYVEVFYSLNRGQLPYEKEKDKWETRADLIFKVRDSQNTLIDSTFTKVGVKIPEFKNPSKEHYIFDKFKVLLPEGEYSYKISFCTDADSVCASFSSALEVPRYKEDKLELSDIYFVSKLSNAERKGEFTKAGRNLLPNIDKVYGYASTVLYFYTEVYNLSLIETDTTSYRAYELKYSVLDSNKDVFREFESERKRGDKENRHFLKGFNIIGFPEGTYYLRAEVTDIGSQEKVSRTEKFVVRKKRDLEGGSDEKFTEKDAQRWRNIISYIATSNELNKYDRLSLQAKREFLKDFWAKKDTTPQTPKNEYKRAYLDRWQYVNSQFGSDESGSSRMPGWKTDRGRVYLVYGPPDDIERNEFSVNSRPWIKWYYFDVQGGVHFIFSDRPNIGYPKLMHSTAEGEVKNHDWFNQLKDKHRSTFDSERNN